MHPLIDQNQVECIRLTGNSSPALPDRRAVFEKWKLPVDREAENVVITGCQIPAGLPHVLDALSRVFDRQGLSHTFLSREYCCGNNLYRPAIKAGDQAALNECRSLSAQFVAQNIKAAKELGARRIIIFCSPCYPIYKQAAPDENIVFYPRALAQCLETSQSPGEIDYYAGCYRLHKKFAPIPMDLAPVRDVFAKFAGLSVNSISAPECCYKPGGLKHMIDGIKTSTAVFVCTGCYIQALMNRPKDKELAIVMLPEFVEQRLGRHEKENRP
ncbi:MAG: heterodisulfide reductase-related iron-sulfur binding cluster [Desulfatibacillaceae bacterium]|nr:heterodisulfide reductase-related iron-sulfur binding cluster [Desulfatibacillaceae bacterium]